MSGAGRPCGAGPPLLTGPPRAAFPAAQRQHKTHHNTMHGTLGGPAAGALKTCILLPPRPCAAAAAAATQRSQASAASNLLSLPLAMQERRLPHRAAVPGAVRGAAARQRR